MIDFYEQTTNNAFGTTDQPLGARYDWRFNPEGIETIDAKIPPTIRRSSRSRSSPTHCPISGVANDFRLTFRAEGIIMIGKIAKRRHFKKDFLNSNQKKGGEWE